MVPEQSEVVVGAKKEDTRPLSAGIVQSPDKRRLKLPNKRYVFTSAQNNTDIHEGFFAALNHFCRHNQAQLVISPFTYNKNGFQNGTKDSDKLYYDPRIEPYFIGESAEVATDLIWCGELDILPTAVNPLSGFEAYTQSASGIIPHAKVQMQSLPRMKGEDPRFLYTTGAVTLRNYIQRKAGQKAEFHHVFGALYVEIADDGSWFARQLIADEGGTFYDLTNQYNASGVITDQRVAAITWGDIHMEKLDQDVRAGSWLGPTSVLSVLDPEYQFIHDLTDFRARNHHSVSDPEHIAKMYFAGRSNVQRDLQFCGMFLRSLARGRDTKVVVVESNHDQALNRWLKEANIRNDPENAEFFHMCNHLIMKSLRRQSSFNVFAWAVMDGIGVTQDKPFEVYDNQIVFLREDDSFPVAGIEQGMHGHRGPNGARGNPRGFRSIGHKVNIGHMHSAGIFNGVYVAGVSGLMDMDYNKGPSSWSHSHIVTYKNGKRAIITMRGEKWRV